MTNINHKINGEQKITGAQKIPGPVFVTNGSFEGEVYLQWDAVKEANNYIVEVSKSFGRNSAGSVWEQVDIISDPHYMIQGLKSGKSYSFRISAILNGRQTAWSEAVTKKVK